MTERRYRILDRAGFLENMHLEKRRAERSKTPLTIAVLTLNANENNPLDSNYLIRSIGAKIRDTDVLGYLGENDLGLLLPDTTKAGAEQVVRKIINGYERPFCGCRVASYPDQIFVRLTGELANHQETVVCHMAGLCYRCLYSPPQP